MFSGPFLRRPADAPGLSPFTYGVLALSIGAAFLVQSHSGIWLRIPAFQWLTPALVLAGVACLSAVAPRSSHLLAVPAVLAVLSIQLLCTIVLAYGVQAFAFPLRDDLLIAADRALGFDWLTFQTFMVERSGVMDVLGLCYDTFFLQVILIPLVLAALGEVRLADRYVSAFIVCGTIMVAVSGVLPATGAAGLVGPDGLHLLFHGATPLTDLFALRDGTMRTIVLAEVGPMISFPSLHCSVAYLATAVFWSRSRLRWAMVFLNSVMTVSAVTHGAHYVCDCLAGLLVAAGSFHVAGWLGPVSRGVVARAHGDAVPSAAPASTALAV